MGKRTVPKGVTRIDIIGDRVHEFWADEWRVLICDEGRTLKLFAEGGGEEPRKMRNNSLAAELSRLIRDAREVGKP